MPKHAFSLVPFRDPNLPDIQISGSVNRHNGRLNLQYIVTGATGMISLPPKSSSPARKDGLWVTTCFEFFLALPSDPQYWEGNISPSGDWNVYHMDAYRRVGFREEAFIPRLPVEVRNEAGDVTLSVEMDLSPFVSETQRLQVGIACIIQNNNHHATFWALVHPESKPDFHLRESFILEL